jgi:hypothetical protein
MDLLCRLIPLPEGRDLGAITAKPHAAPPSGMVFTGIVKEKNALGIFALTNRGIVRARKEIRGQVCYGNN